MTATGAVNRGEYAELERWYRRLLLAYPGHYRRTYGEDILGTLMDSVEPGRRRPSRADVTDLVGSAARQWFRLPVGPSALVAAVLAALVLGAIGAATGSWLSWETAAKLPSTSAALQIGATVAGAPLDRPYVGRSDGPRVIWRSVSLSDENPVARWSLDEARERLRADGWTVGRVEQEERTGWWSDNERLPGTFHRFEATRAGLVINTTAITVTTPGLAGTRVSTDIGPAEPPWTPALTAVGWLAGAIVAWILTGWAGHRLRRRALPHRLAALTLGLTALGLAAQPTIGLYRTLGSLAVADDLTGSAPAYRWVVESSALGLLAGALAAGLGILIVAAIARPPVDRPTVSA